MSSQEKIREAIMTAMKKAGVQGLMRATVFAHLELPVEENAAPTKECMEAARNIHNTIDGGEMDTVLWLAYFLARRDEARDAEVVRPWREALELAWRHMFDLDQRGFKEAVAHVDALLASPSPASSEPLKCDHSCPPADAWGFGEKP